ncbi:MAG: phosphate transport system protein [Chloroflexi bacterium]|jgi:phosphate transport system protein|nr:MAG: phosphate transport system protein [Chloroflexota bacterium]
MTRIVFDKNLADLTDGVLEMGSMVEQAIQRAVLSLRERDVETAKEVIAQDDAIDTKRFELEDRIVELIATQQPMAQDLRTIVSLLHITSELERMGDYAEGIAKINVMMGEEPLLKPLIDIPRMSDLATGMLRGSLDALVERDVEAAKRVWRSDDEVDSLYDEVYKELLGFMIEDPKTITRATWLLWVAHDIERIADRATNIAERVVFLVTGRMVEASALR